MALREHETVVRRSLRIRPVVAKVAVHEHRHEICSGHARSRMAGAGDRTGTNRVDAQLLPELPPALTLGHGCNVTGHARLAPTSAVGARTERVDRLPLPRSPGDQGARADDARRRCLRRHVQPDDFPEGDEEGRGTTAAARAQRYGAARRLLRARRARRRQRLRSHAKRLGRRRGCADMSRSRSTRHSPTTRTHRASKRGSSTGSSSARTST